MNRAEGPRAGRGARAAVSLVGLSLLVAAGIALWRQRETLAGSWAALRDPPTWAVLSLPLATLASIAIGGLLLKRLFRRRPDLRLDDLLALNAAATLFNLLPLKAGLAGRIAWQRSYQAVDVRTSIIVTVAAKALSAGAVAIAAFALWIASWTGVEVAGLLLATATLLLVLAPMPRVGFVSELLWWRLLDLGAWSVRVTAAFAVLGTDLPVESAVALACVAMASGQIPLFGSALGVREWLVALVAPSLVGLQWEEALAAELLARGFEIAVVAVTGGAGTAWLWKRSLAAVQHDPRAV